jgi:hypothetical protein
VREDGLYKVGLDKMKKPALLFRGINKFDNEVSGVCFQLISDLDLILG